MFFSCSSLELVYMPNLEEIGSAEEGLYNGSFKGTYIRSICLPKLRRAGAYAFYNCE